MKLVAVDGKERVQVTVGAAHRLLVVAVLATAVEDIVAGREEVGWLEGAMCRHWCEWLDLEPGAVRRAVALIMGLDRALRNRRPRSVYEERGFLSYE